MLVQCLLPRPPTLIIFSSLNLRLNSTAPLFSTTSKCPHQSRTTLHPVRTSPRSNTRLISTKLTLRQTL